MAFQLSGKKLIGLAIGALLLVRLLIALMPVRLHIGPETTVIESPLRADGTPDYAAYLNDEWSAGVTPENNAAVELIRAFGPEIIDAQVRDAYFEHIGVPIPRDPGLYVEFEDYLDGRGIVNEDDWESFEQFEEDATQAQSEPWTDETYPEVAAWLAENQAAISACIAASIRTRYYSPLLPPPNRSLLEALMPVEQASRSGVRLLITQAMLELGGGNVEQACELTLSCHRLSRLLSEHPTVIGQLFGHSAVAIATAGDQAIVLSGLLAKDQSIAYREKLNALPPLRSMAEVIDHGERFISLDAMIATYAGRISEDDLEVPPLTMKWMLDPNPVLRQFNVAYDEIGAALTLQDRTERNLALADFEQRYSNVERPAVWEYGLAMAIGSRAMISENVGKVMASLMVPATDLAVRAEERAHVRILLTDTGYALAAYKADHEAFPEALDALVPDLLPAVPHDPFTGDPLRYELREDGFLLYSVGENGLDDGGLMDAPTDADDIAFGVTPETDDGD